MQFHCNSIVLGAAAVALLLGVAAGAPARAGSVSSTLSVLIRPPLTIAFTPPNPSIDCAAPAGTVVATVATAGGSGTPVSLSISSGDNVDFAMPGSNVLVATGGIAAGHCGTTQSVVVTATQP
jgi:hypothetical protein